MTKAEEPNNGRRKHQGIDASAKLGKVTERSSEPAGKRAKNQWNSRSVVRPPN